MNILEYAIAKKLFGGSGGGTDDSIVGTPIVVDELPTEGVEGAIYSVPEFTAIAIYAEESLTIERWDKAEIYTSETLPETYGYQEACYVTSENEIYISSEYGWESIDTLYEYGIETKGTVTDVNTITDEGYYAVISPVLYSFTNGKYRKLLTKGNLIFTSNGNGTCRVSGIEAHGNAYVTIPSTSADGEVVTSIGNRALQNISFVSGILISDSVTSIGNYAFSGSSSLKSVAIPASVTSIGSNAFDGCTSLVSVNIPDGITKIGVRTFANCYALGYLEIPNSVTSIDGNAFSSAYSLDEIGFKGTMAQWNAITKGTNWNYKSAITKVHCSDGSVTI